MSVLESLHGAGLLLAGSPPTATVEVGGESVSVSVEPDGGSIARLRARRPVATQPAQDVLHNASLGAAGDTAFDWEPGVLIGSRTLSAPTAAVAYDAVFDLAKATVVAARLLDALAEASADGEIVAFDSAAAVAAALAPSAAAGPVGPPLPPPGPMSPPISPPMSPPMSPPTGPGPGPGPAPMAAPAGPPRPAGGGPGTFTPTHVIPPGGLPAWAEPNPSAAPVSTANPGLRVQLLERRPDGWARVAFDNGWIAWVDGNKLQT